MKRGFILCLVAALAMLSSCGVSKNNQAVTKPRYHHISPTKRWRIDIPIGARHIRFLERKRTKVVRMN